MAKKIWVQFKDMESYRENEVKLCTLLRKTPGECTAYVYIKDVKKIRELYTYSFDEKQIELLNDAFGKDNVKFQERKVKTEQSKAYKRPIIRQIIPCSHDMYAVVKDSDGGECKYKVLLYALCSDGEVYPLFYDNWYGVCLLCDALVCADRYELEDGEVVLERKSKEIQKMPQNAT